MALQSVTGATSDQQAAVVPAKISRALTRVAKDDPREGGEVVWVGFAPPPHDPVPPPQTGERDVVLEMWSRLEHVTLMASGLASMKGLPEEAREKALAIARFCDVDALYLRMQQVLAKADEKARVREEDLRRQLGDALAENRRLHAEIADLRKPK